MRTFVLIALAALALSCAHGTAKTATAAPTATATAAPTATTTAAASPAQTVPAAAAAGSPSIVVEYVKPTNPAHEPLYAEVRDRRVLEQLAEVLAVVKLPKTLALVFKGCDGTSNAWYDEVSASVTFCYEYLADIKAAAVGKKPAQVSLEDAVDGPTVFVLFHETGHAVFDLLKVPVLGREEDAADTFAALSLLRLGKGAARRFLGGAAWAYAHEASTAQLDQSDFADVHGLDSQRYYNILCLAYGSDPEYFGDTVKRGYLPKDRAEGCVDEFKLARYAVQKLIAPSIDQQQLERVKTMHKAKWESAPAAK